MVEKMIVKVVGNYSENDWQNNRTGEKKLIKSVSLVLQNGKESFSCEANDDLAQRVRDMNLKVDTPVLASLYFEAGSATKDNVVRYFQRVRVENIIPLAF